MQRHKYGLTIKASLSRQLARLCDADHYSLGSREQMKFHLNIIVFFFGSLLSSTALSCTYVFIPQEYITVVRMYGVESNNVIYHEASFSLGFTGADEYKVLSQDKNKIISRKNGKLCAIYSGSEEECWGDKNRHVYLGPYLDFSRKKRTVTFFIQKNEEEPVKVKLKKKQVRATEEHNNQIQLKGWSDCYEHT